MSFGYIYKIEFPNGKHYIGQTTTSLKKRRETHIYAAKKSNKQNCLYKALRKYGMVDTFELVEIDTADTKDELCEKEKNYIIEYNSYYKSGGYGHNMTYGGDGLNGYVYTEEDISNMRERKKQYFIDNPEAGKEHGEKMKTYYQDNPDARERMSEKMKTYYQDNPDAKQKNSEAQQKYWEENSGAREKASERQKKYYEDNLEAKENISESLKKYYEETQGARERASEANKKYWEENPIARENARERAIKQFETPEAREKVSERHKKWFDNLENKKYVFDKKGKNKSFDVFKIDGTFVKTFAYQFEANEYLQKEYNIISRIKICAVLNGRQQSSAGFVFKYK